MDQPAGKKQAKPCPLQHKRDGGQNPARLSKENIQRMHLRRRKETIFTSLKSRRQVWTAVKSIFNKKKAAGEILVSFLNRTAQSDCFRKNQDSFWPSGRKENANTI